jgi:hypothetical protein
LPSNLADDIAKALGVFDKGITISDQIASLTKHFKPYKPEVKSFRIDYLNQSSELKYFLNIPSGVTRKTRRRVELPVSYGFRIYDIVDMDSGSLVRVDFDEAKMKWTCNLGSFPNSERFMVTVKGVIGPDFLRRLVDVKAALNPDRDGGTDRYWIHAALRDVSILERVWSELNIDRVNIDVRIGVERFFASAIPEGIKKGLVVRQKLLDAIKRGERNIEGLKLQYRRAEQAGGVSPKDLYDLVLRLVSGEFFVDYVSIDQPFVIGGIEPEREVTALIPERVKVGVLGDLNFHNPAAKGDLRFKRKNYVESVSEEIKQFVPKQKKTTKKKRKREK